MSAEFDLSAVLGSSSISIYSAKAIASAACCFCFSAVAAALRRCCYTRHKPLCCSQQSSVLRSASTSMRLRPKRTSSGVECFGGFHINRFSNLFLFLRGGLT
ncbi:hypothetical protein LINGRAHAP2_LOCUS9614 [Linum grandiflorum]